MAAGHSGHAVTCQHCDTHTTLVGLEPTTFGSLVDCWSDALPVVPATHRNSLKTDFLRRSDTELQTTAEDVLVGLLTRRHTMETLVYNTPCINELTNT